jgi:carbamoyl-phosphate synthase large subunit
MEGQMELRKVMVVGSGPIVIGQAAEFDYAGTQACQALREEGLEVVLLNSNPATIMTDGDVADRVYLEPITLEHAEAVIARERPDGLVATLGGQAGLNLAVALAREGVLDRYGVRLLGTPLEAIRRAEDRELFKEAMLAIGEPVPESCVVRSVEEALAFGEEIGLPVIVRPAYTLGGTGGGIASTRDELERIVLRGLRLSPIGQCLVERSLYGWKEIEYEVMRDGRDNCITVCNMENLDPVGVHTGDSIVVAPSQTLSDRDYQRLRAAALRIVRALGIAGGCNVQFALDPRSDRYYVIEVNPRVSRSSALASKATGYPIAKVAAKIAAGRSLDQIRNPVTGSTYAFFEPALDYVVVKIPRWPFDKFRTADRSLGTQMKATGEVMAIDRTFEGALQKAVRSLEIGLDGLEDPAAADLDDRALGAAIAAADDRRLFLVAEALRRGWPVEDLAVRTGMDAWFLRRIRRVVEAERSLGDEPADWRRAKELGLSDRRIARLLASDEASVRAARQAAGVTPVYKMVDTCAAEFEAATPYFYSCYDREDELPVAPDPAADGSGGRPRVVVLGSGPIRIGQGIEFDYGSVHAVWALRDAGFETVIVNNNPETVSTDFSTSDRLYFDPLTFEDVMNVVDRERPVGVVAQFGGQTAINLAGPLARAGVRILGTPVEGIDLAEDRAAFDALLERLGIPRPPGGAAATLDEAHAIAARVGYPVLVRPSYVLGGRAMEICHDDADLEEYLRGAARVSAGHPIFVDRYVRGTEVEVDAVSDGRSVLIPGILEHVERAGVHSGDSIAVYPPRSLTPEVRAAIARHTRDLARALGVRGLVNIQFVVADDRVYVLEVNPRASRTVPFLTKVTGVPMVRVAVGAILGSRLEELGYPGEDGVWTAPDPDYVAVKMPVFSWSKLAGVDTSLGPEMKSTGEVMGIGATEGEAMAKAFLGAGVPLPRPEDGHVLASIADRDKAEALEALRWLAGLGYRLLATPGTCRYLRAAGVAAEEVPKVGAAEKLDAMPGEPVRREPDVLQVIRSGRVSLLVNTLTRGRVPENDGFRMRRLAAELGVPCVTSLDTARALVKALEWLRSAAGRLPDVWELHEYAQRRVHA